MKIRPKRSPIWQIPIDDLKECVKRSGAYSDILMHFNIGYEGGRVRTLKMRLRAEGIDCSHIETNRQKRHRTDRKPPLEEVMTRNSSYSRGSLKHRLIKRGILKEICNECGQSNTWNGKPLKLVLDHKNGVHNDHRLENLRLLCPNCNSQTETFAGRNKKYKRSITG